MVDTIDAKGFFAVMSLREVLSLAAEKGFDHVLFEEPDGMVEASARAMSLEEAERRCETDVRPREQKVILSRKDTGWTYSQPSQIIELKL